MEKTYLLIQCQNSNYNVEIAKTVRFDCFCHQIAGKKTCCHIIWCLMNIYCLDKNDPRLVQVEFGDNVFHDLVLKTPSKILKHLKTFSSIKARVFCKHLEALDKFNSEQEWFLTRKNELNLLDVLAVWYQVQLKQQTFIWEWRVCCFWNEIIK